MRSSVILVQGALEDVMLFGEECYKPSETFKCQKCGKMYRYKGNLQAHLKFECGKKPSLQCPHCSYRAKQRSNFKGHIALRHFKPIDL
ncbi:hypothetical protein LSTR_LSTR000961 [Laodelphax striatellus]|uniref:C2H2-type domain-containing protein n=1 Tax=Laodelphax striatellus TaxID=195883 RepID=A0A482X241_LAOST|nr:hypothetical protein LSTR_LSTR000961 [Laodelphax striatellus]